jgi:hypothetical protein
VAAASTAWASRSPIPTSPTTSSGASSGVTSDALFTNGKNFFHIDFADGRKRLYYPWDLDAVFGGNAGSIYPNGGDTGYQTILGRPEFRSQYNSLILALTDPDTGPLSESNVHAFVDAIEPRLTDALVEDPNTDIDDPADVFDSLRKKTAERIAKVRDEAIADGTP